MTVYICLNCGNEITPNDLRQISGVRCPECVKMILYKKKPPIIKKLKAR